MAKKATTRATKKAVGIRGGTSKQHARAGRLGGLAPHVCRGSECTKLRKAAAAKKAASAKSVTKTAAKKRSLYAGAFDTKAAPKKMGRPAAHANRLTKSAKNKTTGFFEGLFADAYAAPRRVKRATSTRAIAKTASRTKVTVAKRAKVTKKATVKSRKKLW